MLCTLIKLSSHVVHTNKAVYLHMLYTLIKLSLRVVHTNKAMYLHMLCTLIKLSSHVVHTNKAIFGFFYAPEFELNLNIQIICLALLNDHIIENPTHDTIHYYWCTCMMYIQYSALGQNESLRCNIFLVYSSIWQWLNFWQIIYL